MKSKCKVAVSNVYDYLAMARPAFHSVGVLPYLLGTTMAWCRQDSIHWGVFAWGTLGVIFVMASAYYGGEYWDYKEDTISQSELSTPLSGGSGVVASGKKSRKAAFMASICSLGLALAVGLTLTFFYKTGPWTMPLGLLGVLGGFFYSWRPIRWVERGVGEVWIAFCYGWLPVAAGFYLQAGYIASFVHWASLPVAASIFNVILMNEFPDYRADSNAEKTNLLVLLGRKESSILYSLVGLVGPALMVLAWFQGIPTQVWWFYTPVGILSFLLAVLFFVGDWKGWKEDQFTRWGMVNMLVNLGTTGSLILAFLLHGLQGSGG